MYRGSWLIGKFTDLILQFQCVRDGPSSAFPSSFFGRGGQPGPCRGGPSGRRSTCSRIALWRQSIGQALQGSFSAVSKPNFASKYASESSRRDLHNALFCTALQSQFFVKILPNFLQNFPNQFNLAKFQRFLNKVVSFENGTKECIV